MYCCGGNRCNISDSIQFVSLSGSASAFEDAGVEADSASETESSTESETGSDEAAGKLVMITGHLYFVFLHSA